MSEKRTLSKIPGLLRFAAYAYGMRALAKESGISYHTIYGWVMQGRHPNAVHEEAVEKVLLDYMNS